MKNRNSKGEDKKHKIIRQYSKKNSQLQEPKYWTYSLKLGKIECTHKIK